MPLFRILPILPLLVPVWLAAEPDPDFGVGDSWNPVITKWTHGKDAAISFTFDDNCASQAKYAVPALSERDLRATFFVITDRATALNQWPFYRDLAAVGHEIGSHSASHPDMSLLGGIERRGELRRSREIIDSSVPSQKCFSIALPMGWRDSALLQAAHQEYGAVRIVNQWDGLHEITDVGEVRGMIPYSNTPQSDMDDWVTQALEKRLWLVEIYHGIQEDCWEEIPLDRFKGHLDRVVQDRDRLWNAPFGTVAKYVRLRGLTSASLDSYQDSILEYSVTGDLPGNLTGVPLTVQARLPAGWNGFTAEQDGKPIWSQYKWKDNMPMALFEAMPNGGKVLLRQERDSMEMLKVETNPPPGIYSQPTAVTLRSSVGGTILYNLEGRDPLLYGKKYRKPILLDHGTRLTYRVITSRRISKQVMCQYVIEPSAPVIAAHPASGSFISFVSVSLESNPSKEMRYTLDGTDPDSTSPIYAGPVRIGHNAVLKIIAKTASGQFTPALSLPYTILPSSKVGTPSPPGGTYNQIQRVSLATPEGWDVRYTLDGSDPESANAVHYQEPIWIGKSAVLKYRLIRDNVTSALFEAKYEIQPRQSLNFNALPVSASGQRQGQISFSVANAGPVRLVLRDAEGRQILKFFDGVAEPLHEYTFSLPSNPMVPGAYFYDLEQNGIPILKRRVIFRR